MGISKIKNLGIGTDIENIDRFRKLDRVEDKLFFDKIFTKNELDYCFSKKDFAPHLTARFAGKEAVIKASNHIGKVNLYYKDIEIFNDKNRVPKVRIKNKNFSDLHIYISLSHCEDKALAFAVVIRGGC